MVSDLARNLYAGARLSFMLPVDRSAFRPSLDQAFVLLVFGSAAMLCFEIGSGDGGWLPPPDHVGFYALALLAGLVGCFAATRLLGLTERLSTIVVMLLSGAIWLMPVFGPVFALADPETLAPNTAAGATVGIILVLWFLIIAIRAIHAVTGRGIIRPAVAASVLVIIAALPKLVLTTPAAWLPAPAKLPHSWTQENLYYGQFGMMNRTIDWLKKNRPGKTDLYFVGFGADTREPVFLNEMRAVAQLFETRFGTADRTVVMLNNHNTIRHVPLANVHNLGRTIREIGERMNGKEDILFLYLSVPALTKGEIQPAFEPLDFASIHPSAIRQMMDEADIENRIVVLSSCAAPGFADRLRGPNTLVIVASGDKRRADGCTGNAAYTTFGQAFFGTALSEDFNLIGALEKTRSLLAENSTMGLRPAPEPVIKVGAAIAPTLSALATQLAADRADSTAIPSVTAPRIRSPKIRQR